MAKKDKDLVIVQSPWRNVFLKEVKESEESIFLVAPRIKTEAISWIRGVLLSSLDSDKEFSFNLLTIIDEMGILMEETDLEGLNLTLNMNLGKKFKSELASIPNLSEIIISYK